MSFWLYPRSIIRCEEYDMCSWCPYAKACAELVDKVDEQQPGMLGRGLEKVPSGHKEKVFPQINDIYVIVEELDDRIERLKKECPIQWEPFALRIKRADKTK